MFHRLLNPLLSNSFFLFGARGTGKSTFVTRQLKPKNSLMIDLLDPETEDLYIRNPKRLEDQINTRKFNWVIIDEVQRVPRLLDLVHRTTEKNKQKFILTGSSARKLKRGAANLLAGRAFVNYLFPLTYRELAKIFELESILRWGSLPNIFSLKTELEKISYLKAYSLTYLNEEIKSEQLVRNLDPFRYFLEIAAQTSGKLLNYSNIAKDVGVDTKTVQNYYSILEETWIGIYLNSFHRSIRKSQKTSPKFLFFDLGVKNLLDGYIDSSPKEGTALFGDLFEQYIILEIYRLNHYFSKNYKLSHFSATGGIEVDLVLTKARQNLLVEIKSNKKIDEVEVRKLKRALKSFPEGSSAYYLSRDDADVIIDGVRCQNWKDFLDQQF